MSRSAVVDAEIDALRLRQEDIYRQSPKELISHSNQERQTKRDYRRREILELLQNADDAAGDGGTAGRLLFRLSADRLIVANTGAPFTPDGIESIVVSHVSPKQFSRQRHIGSKGLGFRSVLNWTEHPLIRSGPYAVSFNPAFAHARIEEIASKSPPLRQWWRELEASRGPGAVPLLRFPYVPDPGDADLQLTEQILQEGYDTVLVFPFLESDEDRSPYEILGEQLDELGPEVLLFCRHLCEVTFEKEGEGPQRWEVVRECGTSVIDGTTLSRVCLSSGEQAQLWTVHLRAGTLPPERARLAPDTPDYEVAVAVPDEPVSGAEHRLCVFFPTDETVPSVCLLHATLLLEANRKHPVADDRINTFVLEQLADLWVEVAEYRCTDNPTAGLALLEGAESAGAGLVGLGFADRVLARCREATLFPRIDGHVATAGAVVRMPEVAWTELLDPAWSAETLTRDAEEAAPGLINALELDWYPPPELRARLERWTAELDPGEAGRVVGHLLPLGALKAKPPPALLRLESGDSASDSVTAFLPREGFDIALPSWVRDFAFLDTDFVEGARAAAGLRTLRALADRFETAGYAVREFNAEGVTRHLVQALERWTPEPGWTEADGVRDVLATLLHLVEAEPEGRELPFRVSVLTETGRIRAARECYFGAAYPSGELLAAMYGPLGEDEFVAAPADLGIAVDAKRAEAFLARLGVSSSPRLIDVDHPYQTGDSTGYSRYVLESLPYPLMVEDITLASAEHARSGIDVRFRNLTMPDRWPEVLDKGDSVAVLAYLAGSGDYHLRPAGQPHASLGLLWRRQYRTRWTDLRFPSPALYLLRTRAWVPCTDGSRRRPAEVAVTPTVRRHLAGFLGDPAFDLERPLLRSLGAHDVVREILARLGAFQSFSDLDVRARLDLLRSLPRIDAKGKHAPSIYGALLEERAAAAPADAVQEFAAHGSMWGRRGDAVGYWPVKQLRYAIEAVPGPVQRHVPLVSIPPRKSAAEVEALFGIRRLGRDDYRISVDEALTVEQSWSQEAERWFRALIPVLYAYRLSVRADEGRDRRRFAELHLRVCKALACAVEVGGESSSDFVTEPYAALAIEGTLFVISREGAFSPDPLFCDALGEGLADHLGVPGEASSLASFLHCRTPAVALTLLDRRSGGRGGELLERASAQLEWTDEAPSPIRLPEAVRDEPSSEEMRPAGEEPEPSPAPLGDVPEPAHAATPEESTFLPEPTPVRQTKTRVAWKQHAPTEAEDTQRTRVKQSLTLQIAEEFERQAGRFPLRVHTAVGTEAFGCDIISFATQEDLQAAQSEGEVNPDLVMRFIEVKGRSNRVGGVELTENEQTAAVTRAERYYLYRVFMSAGVVELAVLEAPATSEAFRLVTRYEYLLTESPRTQWYRRVAAPER